MKKLILLTICGIGSAFAISQDSILPPNSEGVGVAPDFSTPVIKAAVDSCGAYFNNYVGLAKTSTLFFESLRTGNTTPGETGHYAGRAQLFHAPQPIEVSGIQFYAHHTNVTPGVDSLPVITILYDYDAIGDIPGAELARDTAWVTESSFSPVLPSREVSGTFSAVTVTDDYMVAIITETDDSIKVYTSDPAGDGSSEAVSYIFYKNEALFPGYEEWFNAFVDVGPSYDLDYLISPLVKYDLHDSYTILNDTICPNATAAGCVDYTQMPVFADAHYNNNSATPLSNIQWLWGDGFQNTMITSACHTYSNSGTYDLTLNDSLNRHMVGTNYCRVSVTQSIYVLDSVNANFSNTSVGFTSDFVNTTAEFTDSISWDFGDGTLGGNDDTPSHVYSALGDYDVWIYAYGPCNTDSTMITITISDVGVMEKSLAFDVYPNPATSTFTISGNLIETEIHIYNLLGVELFTNTSSTGNQIIDCSNWPTGTYLVQVIGEGEQKTSKIVVK